MQLLARANSMIFAFSITAFPFCGFNEILILMFYLYVVSDFIFLSTLNWQFALDWFGT